MLAANFDDAGWEAVPVPAKWENYGGAWANADGEAIFRRRVNIPKEWAGRDLIVSLGPIDDFDDTFWNGIAVGRTDKTTPSFWSVPRNYRVPGRLVKAGPSVVAVRVFDHGRDGGLVGKPEQMAVSLAEGEK